MRISTIAAVVVLVALLACLLRSKPVQAQASIPIVVSTLADVTGNGAAQQVSSAGTTCRYIQFVALAANAAVVRVGDASVSATQGVPLAPGGAWNTPPPTDVNRVYARNAFYFYAGSGDKLSATCGN